MNRAILITAGLAAVGALPGQQTPSDKTTQTDPIERLVTEMRAAEQGLKSIRVELATSGSFPSGLEFSTQGTLHVLRGEQPRQRVSVRMRFANDLQSRMDSAQTAAGITIYKDDPAFGEVYLQVAPEIARDLAWAGEVLDRSDLPGMRDARAEAPLGSTMLEGLRREFDLQPTDRKQRGDDAGVWLVGERRSGLGDVEFELPLATRVEMFVRDKDHALLEVVHYRDDKVMQKIEVRSLEVDVEIPDSVFEIDGRGQELREVEKYVPLWSQILDVIAQAERKLAGTEIEDELKVRPSERGKLKKKPGDAGKK